jgi:hypothetical protein
VGQALAFEIDGLHLFLDPGMGMMGALVVEGFDRLDSELDGDHRW